LWHIERNQKKMLAFGHLQGMQLKIIGMNFNMLLYHHQPSLYVLQCVVLESSKSELKSNVH
jgi:hypothetical protein